MKNQINVKPKVRLLAYYLPQYHPIKENDAWWGEGFTEWISVAQARPLFKGHYQPKIPGELGFYDLRLDIIREKQAQLAKEHGIEGFCYWHYWLGNGRRLLELPFNRVLESGKPDFPFCLGWANHSWKGVFFGSKGRTLIEQTYNGIEDAEEHFKYLLKAFKDKRYILVNGKPLLHIHSPKSIPNCKSYLNHWRKLALEAGLNGLYIIGESLLSEEKGYYGVDAVTYSNHRKIESGNNKNRYLRYIYRKIFRLPFSLKKYEYKEAIKYFLRNDVCPHDEIPSIVPNWDTTARLGRDAVILHNSTPSLFKQHVKQVLKSVENKSDQTRLVFIKSWNEWAEGNYIEPDRKFGKKYLEALRDEVYKK